MNISCHKKVISGKQTNLKFPNLADLVDETQ